MLIGSILLFTILSTILVNTKRVKASGSSSLENLLSELISTYEERIRNDGLSRTRPPGVIRRRNISLPSNEDHTVKYSFSIRGSLDNLKSPVVHLFKSKKKVSDSYNRTECARYKLLTKRTNEEFLAYLDKLIEQKTTYLREMDSKIVDTKRKINKARLGFARKLIHKPMTNAKQISNLESTEYMLRCRLMEKLNNYLAAATNLLLPVEPFPNAAALPQQMNRPYQLPRRLYRRSVDYASKIPNIPFLGENDLSEIQGLIRGSIVNGGPRKRWIRQRPRVRKRFHPSRRQGGVT